MDADAALERVDQRADDVESQAGTCLTAFQLLTTAEEDAKDLLFQLRIHAGTIVGDPRYDPAAGLRGDLDLDLRLCGAVLDRVVEQISDCLLYTSPSPRDS